MTNTYSNIKKSQGLRAARALRNCAGLMQDKYDNIVQDLLQKSEAYYDKTGTEYYEKTLEVLKNIMGSWRKTYRR